MTTFSALPDELLLEIFYNIQSHCDVLSLALQSKRFHALSDLATRRKFRRVRVAADLTIIRACSMLLQILRKPNLGHYVRYLEMDCADTFVRYGEIHKQLVQPADMQNIKEAIKRAGLDEEDDEARILGIFDFPPESSEMERTPLSDLHHMMEVLTVLFASSCPRLESLGCCELGEYTPKWQHMYGNDSLSPTWRENANPGPTNLFSRFLIRVGCEPDRFPFLRHLKTARFFPDTFYDTMGEDEIYIEHDFYHSLNAVRRLPAIESVRFDAMKNSVQAMSVRPPPLLGNYNKLELCHSIIVSESLCDIVESPKALRELTITTGGRCYLGDDGHGMSLKRLLRSLLLHRNTLEYLNVDVEDNFDYQEDNEEDDEWTQAWAEADRKQWEAEWEEELHEQRVTNARDESTGENFTKSLRSFSKLRFLKTGILSLCYFSRGIDDDVIDHAQFSLVDNLPPNLESLCIYGYDRQKSDERMGNSWLKNNSGIFSFHDQILRFTEEKAEKLPRLKSVEGVEEHIPRRKTLEYYPEHEKFQHEMVWQREMDEWTEYDF